MLLEVCNVEKSYPLAGSGLFSNKKRQIINDVSFSLEQGDCIGVIGESGSGKSTLARLICGLEMPNRGHIRLNGKNVVIADTRKNHISVVFQDYASSVNPLMTVFQMLSEPLLLNQKLNRQQLDARISELLLLAGLPDDLKPRHAHELSGGQIQRIAICRAIATNPELIILDEAISSLDVSSQVQILDLLARLKSQLNLSYLFITHDIQAVAYLCNKVLFFYQGRIIERCNIDDLVSVKHQYAQRLLKSVVSFD
ncbi:ABC transporter ATP-binding protein [Budvicia aquatica]|uniref:ABC transporter ATP-binding protein n=1 Tax=Budvicia aquatica TaxID=82979 RepID=A0A2C6DHH2_9GAMM|nr:dipeptide/oligopeptide/nickel ABC transporter ATP-binding protein [Budvicia aquatica]PHI30656.1 ABC transporter ATP-binding protein [Budvicia aquatica]VFS50176.1 Glutathione import ATP-binding protein GsiA [Budvicia aquatica]